MTDSAAVDEFLGVVDHMTNITETAFSSDNGNEDVEAKSDEPLLATEAVKLPSRVPFESAKLTVGAPTLSKDETSAIIESKKGSKKY